MSGGFEQAHQDEANMATHERIAADLRAAGLDARPIDGWVYVALPDGRLLWIGAENGQSLDTAVYDNQPQWFTNAPIEREPPPASTTAVPSAFQQLLRDMYRY